MRAVTRSACPPSSLAAIDKKGKTELARAQAHFANPVTRDQSFEFTAYRALEVKRQLETLFYGKCAYCESDYSSTAPVDVEHFRPKGAVADSPDHRGYWWLAADWDNLLPSCIDCNRRRKQSTPLPGTSLAALDAASRAPGSWPVQTVIQLSGKKDCFPILGTRAASSKDALELEQPLLLDPCRDDPRVHLRFHVDPNTPMAFALPAESDEPSVDGDLKTNVSARGAVSIQIYGLNRLGLIQARTRILRKLEFLGSLVIELAGIADELDASQKHLASRICLLRDRILAEIRHAAHPEEPYSEVAVTWIEEFRVRLAP